MASTAGDTSNLPKLMTGKDLPKVNYYHVIASIKPQEKYGVGKHELESEERNSNLNQEESIGFHIINSKTASKYIYEYGPYIVDITVPDDALVGTYTDLYGNTVYVATAINVTNKRKISADVLKQLIDEGVEPNVHTMNSLVTRYYDNINYIASSRFTKEELEDILGVFYDYVIKSGDYTKFKVNAGNTVIPTMENGVISKKDFVDKVFENHRAESSRS
jgi:hypothetical protein